MLDNLWQILKLFQVANPQDILIFSKASRKARGEGRGIRVAQLDHVIAILSSAI